MLHENVQRVRDRIAAACQRVGRPTDEVCLVGVCKGRALAQTRALLETGLTDIGESRVREAREKYGSLVEKIGVRWHLIGHLQTNKVKEAVRIFDLIHSLDSLRLAEEIDRQAARLGKRQEVLIEIKTSPEATKAGVLPQEAAGFLEAVSGLRHIAVRGFMTIAPAGEDPGQARPYFRALRELGESVRFGRGPWIYSMGMSDDFEAAVEEGATLVRIGRALFG